jgi:hypothetical protein
VAVEQTWARSAPEKCSVARASRSTSTPASGRPGQVVAQDRARAGASGGSTSSIRSNRPGRRRAGSTSHGWLVAPSTNRPSSGWSSSASSVFTVLRRLEECVRCERFCPSASTSSKNSTHGAWRRAAAKTCARFRSLDPVHMSSTSATPTEKNAAPSSPATARAR